MQITMRQPAIIYCRVSDKGQTGLGSQEHRCRQHAADRDYDVVQVFYDEASGGGDFMKRKGMVALINYLDDHPHINFVVIFDDIRRYAREAEFHLTLRRLMEERGAKRECLNYNFEDSPEGKFNETVNAAVGQLERETNARQARQKKIARLEAGYAVYNKPPIGYRFIKAKHGNNKILVRHEPTASIVQDILEGFASNRFTSQAEIMRRLNADPCFPKPQSTGKIKIQKVTDMLTQPIYAGYVSSKELGVPLTPAKHEGLISKATYEKIQGKLKDSARTPARKDLNKDFVLRGAVACSCCGANLKSSWSKGNKQYYAYYLCQTKGCEKYGKSIPRAKIEGAFEDLIHDVQPSKVMIKAVIALCKLHWDKRIDNAKASTAALKTELGEIEGQVSKLIERIVESANDRVISALENKIDDLERKKMVIREKLENTRQIQPTFEESLELSLRFLSNPQRIWRSGIFNLQRLMLKLVFREPLHYSSDGGYRTPKTSLPFNMLEGKSGEFLPVLKDGAAEKTRTSTGN